MQIKFIQKIIDKIRNKKQKERNFSSENYIKFKNEDLINIFETLLYFIPNSNVLRPDVIPPIDTIKELQNSSKSIARFGDGEIFVINKTGIAFQEYNPELGQKLFNILKNNQDNLLLGINYHYFYPEYNTIGSSNLAKEFYIKNIPNLRRDLLKIINLNSKYCSADLYLAKYKEEAFIESKKIWDNKEIVIVTCENLIKNIKYNIYSNAKDIKYIFIPNKNCYSETQYVYQEIEKYGKDKIYILQAGPSATVWASELANMGYRALDLGHLQKLYDFYKQGIDMSKSENVVKMFGVDE